MKKLWMLGAVAVMATTTLLANQIQVGYSGSSFGPYQTGQGGEFTFNDINPDGWLDLSGYVPGKTSGFGGGSTFQTFCIERGESISGYAATYNAAVNTAAVYGGVGPSGDPISVGTGWLYCQFATGTLAYNYSGTAAQRKADANLLQRAIWWLEGESGIGYDGSNPYMAAVVAHFGSAANAKADGGWLYGVYALNLWKGSDPLQNRAQDSLYYRPVPDGGLTVMLLGLGLGSVAFVSRRIRK